MNRRTQLRVLYSILTVLFVAATISNISHYVYFDPQVVDHCAWEARDDGKELVITRVSKGGVADQAGIKTGDILLALDDRKFEQAADAQKYLDKHQPGDQITYNLKRGNEAFDAVVTLAQKNRLLPLLNSGVGLLFLLVGFVVVYNKPWTRTPRLFYFYSLTFFIMLSFTFFSRHQPYSEIIRSIRIAGLMLWGPSMVHLFMNFPLRIPLLNKHPRAVFLFYLPSILAFPYTFFINPELRLLGQVTIGLYFAGSFFLLGMSSAKITDPHERKSIRVIKYGMYFGLTPLGILAFLPDVVLNLFGITGVAIVYGLMGLVPLAFGYSIMRYGLMDVEIIIKKSLIYSLLTSSFVLLYFLIVMVLGGYLASNYGFGGQVSNILFLVIVAIAFQPVRNAIQDFVDRRFYRKRYEYQKTLLILSQELPGLINMSDIINRVMDNVSKAMNVSTVMIHLYDQKTKQYLLQSHSDRENQPDIYWKEAPKWLVDLVKWEKSWCLCYKIEEDERYNKLPISEKVKIKEAGIVLTIPMFSRSVLIGMICLGPKESGLVYNQEDIDLLQTVAGNAAIALMNAHLHQEELSKQRLQNELVMARHIQEGLLPKNDPELPGLEITGISKPATEVGGDYFDYLKISNNRMLLLVGDVSGKGMPAAIYMSKIQGMVQMATGFYSSPREILMDVNRRIYPGLERKSFITMTTALVDAKQKKISICRAGHTPALLKCDNSIEFFAGKGIGLGLDEGDIFDRELEETHLNLKKDDYCILFTDGLIEAMNPNRETYGEERLQSILENGGFDSAEELKKRLLTDIEEFQSGEPQFDDITFVIVRAR